MSSLIEKVTLYDLLGYAFPGGILLCLLFVRWSSWDIVEKAVKLGDFSGLLIVIFAMFSFSVGSIVSQITRLLVDLGKGICARLKSNKIYDYLECKEIIKEKNAFSEITVWNLRKALKNSGVLNEDMQIDDTKLIKHFFNQMYSDIQTDSSFNRVHNYASTALVNKNMAGVAAIGTAVFWNYPAVTGGIQGVQIIGIIFTVLFGMRWRYFNRKKDMYTIYWYIEKYVGKQQNTIKKEK